VKFLQNFWWRFQLCERVDHIRVGVYTRTIKDQTRGEPVHPGDHLLLGYYRKKESQGEWARLVDSVGRAGYAVCTLTGVQLLYPRLFF
jgi:hypothetical protein